MNLPTDFMKLHERCSRDRRITYRSLGFTASPRCLYRVRLTGTFPLADGPGEDGWNDNTNGFVFSGVLEQGNQWRFILSLRQLLAGRGEERGLQSDSATAALQELL